MKTTTSIDRFNMIANHANQQKPDRTEVHFGFTSGTGIHVQAIQNLRRYYGLKDHLVLVTDSCQMRGEVDFDKIDFAINTINPNNYD